MKLLLLAPLLVLFLIPQAFATSLENTELNAKSAVITLDIKFGQDEVNLGFFSDIEKAQLESIYLSFYGDEIILSEPETKVVNNHFRISSIPEGIMMFGHKNIERDNYNINIYFPSSNGLEKFSVSTIIKLPEDKVVESEPVIIKEYVPKLEMTYSNDFRTYWNDNFNMDVQVFDTNINKEPRAYEFEGRVNDVNITAIISLGDELITTLKGVTQNGQWNGEHYFNQRSIPGKYTIDILASLGNQTISKTSSMFVIAYFASGPVGGGNNAPIANAGIDQPLLTTPPTTIVVNDLVTLDGSGSSDPDGDTITYSWVFDTVPVGNTATLNNAITATPNFTPNVTGTYVIQLTVVDSKGANSTDTVTITVNP